MSDRRTTGRRDNMKHWSRVTLFPSNPVAVKAWHHVKTGRYSMVSYLYLLATSGAPA